MSHGSASAHSHRYSLHLFLKMKTSTGLSCLCTHHALWRLWQGLNAWLCALSSPDHAPCFFHVRPAHARRRSILLDRCEATRCATRLGLICLCRRLCF